MASCFSGRQKKSHVLFLRLLDVVDGKKSTCSRFIGDFASRLLCLLKSGILIFKMLKKAVWNSLIILEFSPLFS